MAGKLEIAFDNNAIVRIVSQDGNLVLHKENISIIILIYLIGSISGLLLNQLGGLL